MPEGEEEQPFGAEDVLRIRALFVQRRAEVDASIAKFDGMLAALRIDMNAQHREPGEEPPPTKDIHEYIDDSAVTDARDATLARCEGRAVAALAQAGYDDERLVAICTGVARRHVNEVAEEVLQAVERRA